MEGNNKVVRIFMLPRQFPCGPQSSCCGPIGQTEEEIETLKNFIQKELNVKVEVLNVMEEKDMRNHLQIVRLVHTLGPMALPIITLNDEVVSFGMPEPEQAILAIKEKMNQLKEVG